MAEHRTLTGDSLHEPKGVENAIADSVYFADGAGSGDWRRPIPSTTTITSGSGTYTVPSNVRYIEVTVAGKTPIATNNSADYSITFSSQTASSGFINVNAGTSGQGTASGGDIHFRGMTTQFTKTGTEGSALYIVYASSGISVKGYPVSPGQTFSYDATQGGTILIKEF